VELSTARTARSETAGRLLAGDLDKAMECFQKALQMDRDNPSALLSMGIAHKLRGELAKAREYCRRPSRPNPEGPSGQEAARLLDQMNAAAPPPQATPPS
jgi:Tfp pilus assembly protein PilF